MKAVFFGSIGTIVETSEMQRDAFNLAFKVHGLSWHWDAQIYRDKLLVSGGKARIAAFARARGETVEAGQIHATKTEIFQKLLGDAELSARDGVIETLEFAKQNALKSAFLSTTDLNSINMVRARTKGLRSDYIDLVTSAQNAFPQKPSTEVFQYGLSVLNVAARDVVVIEDNIDGVVAAKDLGCYVIAFPGANTQGQRYSAADEVITTDLFGAVRDKLLGESAFA